MMDITNFGRQLHGENKLRLFSVVNCKEKDKEETENSQEIG